VAEEDGLKKLLTSDEDSEEEKKEEDKEKEEENDKKDKEGKETKDKKKKKSKKKDTENKKDSSDFSSDSSDSDDENSKSKKLKKDKDRPGSRQASANNSRPASPSIPQLEANKRKAGANMPIADFTGSDNSNSPMSTPAKKARMDGMPSLPKNFAGVVNANSKE
jgi:transcription initiation factor TFIIF subunit alpha